jgi:hypothetical protein
MKAKTQRRAAKTTAAQLQSPTARGKLKARTQPYFVRVGRGAWLGYRKPASGPGLWVARAGDSVGKGWSKTLPGIVADDKQKADGSTVLDFRQAETEIRKLTGCADRREAGKVMAGIIPGSLTTDEALKAYELELRRRGAGVSNARLPRYHMSDTMLATSITLLTEQELEAFRDGMLAKGNAPSSANRVMNSLRAALTLADKTRIHIWRGGLKALPDATEANNVVIDDVAKAAQWVAEAYRLDHGLGLLTHVTAETGARPSQSARLKVRDLITVDPKAPRLQMPKSGKGGTRHPGQRKLERYSVSISPELAKLLKAAAKGRPSNAPLLLQKSGQPWSETDPSGQYRHNTRKVVVKIGLDPDVYGLYAFRHTSITRMLLQKVEPFIVAKCHDTSEAIIRRHYAAAILDFTDAMTRATLPSFGPGRPVASNVVPMTTKR